MGTSRPGIAFVVEEHDLSDFYAHPGRFSARWELGEEERQGPANVSVEEAIAWGREQADVVLVRLADSDYYSAGIRHPKETLPLWPEGKTVSRRRIQGMEYLDIDSADPILWQARTTHLVSDRHPAAHAERLRDALRADPDVASVGDVEIEAQDRVTLAVIHIQLRACSHPEAMEAVARVEQRAGERAPYPADDPPRGEGWTMEVGNPFEDIRPA